ncbi:hypothetical protein SGI37_20470, partial [Providencia rettgeri]
METISLNLLNKVPVNLKEVLNIHKEVLFLQVECTLEDPWRLGASIPTQGEKKKKKKKENAFLLKQIF